MVAELDAVADVAQDVADLPAEEQERDDRDERDQGEDQRVLRKALTILGLGESLDQVPNHRGTRLSIGLASAEIGCRQLNGEMRRKYYHDPNRMTIPLVRGRTAKHEIPGASVACGAVKGGPQELIDRARKYRSRRQPTIWRSAKITFAGRSASRRMYHGYQAVP